MEEKIQSLKNKCDNLKSRKITHKLKHFVVEITWVWIEDCYPQKQTFQVIGFNNQDVYQFLMDVDEFINRYRIVDSLIFKEIESNSKGIFNKEFKDYCQEILDLCSSSEYTESDWVKVQQYL